MCTNYILTFSTASTIPGVGSTKTLALVVDGSGIAIGAATGVAIGVDDTRGSV